MEKLLPTTTSAKVERLHQGDCVVVYQVSLDDEWLKNATGWIPAVETEFQENSVKTPGRAVVASISNLAKPIFAELAVTGTHSNTSDTSDWPDWARHHARNLALTEPYEWE